MQDTNTYTIREVEEKAADILNQYWGHKGFPVNPIKIAEDAGFSVYHFNPEDEEYENISGAIDYENKKIFFNKKDSINHQRFTIAHELGHFALHPGETHIDYRIIPADGRHSSREQDANTFAAELLMPTKEFISFYKKNSSLKSTADHFQTSILSTTIRAYKLGLISDV